MSNVSARPPNKIDKALNMRDLPEPVSPVIAVVPEEKSKSRYSAVIKFFIVRLKSNLNP